MRYRPSYRVLLIDGDPKTHDVLRRIVDPHLGPRYGENAGRDAETSDAGDLDFPAWLELDCVCQGWEGWELVRASLADERPFGLVLIDVDLKPDWDGVETAARIRDLEPSLPVVFCTDNPSACCERVARQLGGLTGFCTVAKPFVPSQLLQTMAWQLKHLEVRQECDQLALQLEAAEQTIQRMHEEAETSGGIGPRLLEDFRQHVRSPMHTLLGFSEQLLKEPLGPDKLRRLKYVNQAGKSLLRLVDDLLDYCELSGGRLQLAETSFELDTVVRDVIQQTTDAARAKGVAVEHRSDPSIPRVLRGDETRLRKVLLHLAENAVCFTEQGLVRIETALMAEDQQAATVRLAVIDNGVGIPSDRQPFLFDGPSSLALDAACRPQSLGVGLSVCRQLVHLMGGRIGVDSVPGQGSTFWFTVVLGKDRIHAPAIPSADRGDLSCARGMIGLATLGVSTQDCQGTL